MNAGQITPAQKARLLPWPSFWDTYCWSYCVAIWMGTAEDDPKGIEGMGIPI